MELERLFTKMKLEHLEAQLDTCPGGVLRAMRVPRPS